MVIFDWAIVVAVCIGFLIIMLFSWSDLLRDLKYYRNKSKNVRHMKAFKRKSKPSKDTTSKISKT